MGCSTDFKVWVICMEIVVFSIISLWNQISLFCKHLEIFLSQIPTIKQDISGGHESPFPKKGTYKETQFPLEKWFWRWSGCWHSNQFEDSIFKARAFLESPVSIQDSRPWGQLLLEHEGKWFQCEHFTEWPLWCWFHLHCMLKWVEGDIWEENWPK